MWGGEMKKDSNFTGRDIENFVHILDVKQRQWSRIVPRGAMVTPRKYHTAVIVGSYMIVHGGLDSKSNLLEDLGIYNFKTNEWMTTQQCDNLPGKIAYHTAILSEIEETKRTKKKKVNNFFVDGISSMRILIFGGIDEDG